MMIVALAHGKENGPSTDSRLLQVPQYSRLIDVPPILSSTYLPLAMLAPDVVEKIAAGQQPVELTTRCYRLRSRCQ